MSSPASTGGRAADLDLLKTLLVWGMIGAHVVQLITYRPKPEPVAFADFINLVTFSGFMFAFGLGVGLRPQGRARTLWQRLWPVLMLLAGTYISSFGYVLLVEKQRLTAQLVTDLLTLTRLFGWSEFLATFTILYALLAMARPVFVAIGRHPLLLIGVSALCLAATLVTTEAAWPVIAAVIGTHRFASFPLIPYLPWFLLGIWFAANPLRWWHAVPALAATAGFAYVTMTAGAFPERFPPSALWVIGAAAPLLVYWAASRAVARAVSLPGWLLLPGRHVLSFLVLSNLVIFGSRFFFGRLVRDTFTIALVALAIVCGLSIIWLGIELLRARRGVQTPAAVRS